MGRAEDLSEGELSAVVSVVRAVVAHDEAALREFGAYDDGAEPYMWVDEALSMPPGDPRTWPVSFVRTDEDGWCAVEVDMWTPDGRSDLTLQLELRRTGDGTIRATFEDLHVL